MRTDGWVRHRVWLPSAGGALGAAILAGPLALLLAPAIYYALDTPIGLMERTLHLGRAFGSFREFVELLRDMAFKTEYRFRPFFSLWNGWQWKVFGEVAWLHHVVRWLMLFCAVSFFMAAFRRVAHAPTAAGARRLTRVVPAAVLAYVWLLFPTSITTVRIECPELYTMFFLGVCNYAAALMLQPRRPPGQPGTTLNHDGAASALLLLGFVGLVFSKEVNVAPALWIVLCYAAFVAVRGVSRQRLLIGLMLSLTLAFAAFKVSAALADGQRQGAYFAPTEPFLESFTGNAEAVLRGLFLWETSPLITAMLALPPLGLLIAVGVRAARRGLDADLAFILLLFGEAVSMVLVLSAQFGITLRYWSILVPCLATLLAFAAKFALAAAERHRGLANCIAGVCLACMALFVSANYYSFLRQVVTQHSERNVDDRLLARLAKLLDAGEYVQVRSGDWRFEQVGYNLDTRWNHWAHWPNSPYGENSLHRHAPTNPRQPYYILDFLGAPGLVSLAPHTALAARSDYGVLHWPRRVAARVQGGAPHVAVDWGIHEFGSYRWAIHAVPHDMGEHLQGVLAAAGERIGDGVFEVYKEGTKLTYVRRGCGAKDTEQPFFLHIHPAHESDLPPRGKHGFQNEDFQFADWGVRKGALCVAVLHLPNYPIEHFLTGQYAWSTGEQTWRVVYP